ncbi:MAG: PspA/IM30 family protein [Thiohalocapsa sp.]|nr:PspA/IM30 family protein [Thiohalocapsa sp.]
MAVMTRLSRLIQADLHALLDRLEAPDIVLAQSLRDMADSIERDERLLAELRREHAQIGRRRQALAQQASRSADELTLCLDSGEDDLARALLRRRLKRERIERLLAQRLSELDSRGAALAERLDTHRSRLGELRAEAQALAGVRAGADADAVEGPASACVGFNGGGVNGGGVNGAAGVVAGLTGAPVSDDEVEIALLAEKRRRAS